MCPSLVEIRLVTLEIKRRKKEEKRRRKKERNHIGKIIIPSASRCRRMRLNAAVCCIGRPDDVKLRSRAPAAVAAGLHAFGSGAHLHSSPSRFLEYQTFRWRTVLLAILTLFTATLAKQGVALTGRNRTGPPCSAGRPTAHAPGPAAADHPRARRPTRSPAGSVTDDDNRRRR